MIKRAQLGAGCARRRRLEECTRRLAALSRAVECLAMDFVQTSCSGCLTLGLTQHRRPPPSIRPRCRHQRPHRHRSRPPPLPMLPSPAP
eukprot:7378851-Prymnesium_polylepis.1